MRPIYVLPLLLAASIAHASGPSVAALSLPSRHAAGDRTQKIAALVSQRLHGRVMTQPKGLDVADKVARAKRLMSQVKMDEAATLLDGAIDEGARSPDKVSNPDS